MLFFTGIYISNSPDGWHPFGKKAALNFNYSDDKAAIRATFLLPTAYSPS
jgi:allophanate hydrolase subunit 1